MHRPGFLRKKKTYAWSIIHFSVPVRVVVIRHEEEVQLHDEHPLDGAGDHDHGHDDGLVKGEGRLHSKVQECRIQSRENNENGVLVHVNTRTRRENPMQTVFPPL